MGFPGGTVDARDVGSMWVGKIPWRRKWKPTPAFLPREFHGQGIPVGYNPTKLQRVGHDWAHTRIKKKQITGPHLQRFWFSRYEPRPKNLPFSQAPIKSSTAESAFHGSNFELHCSRTLGLGEEWGEACVINGNLIIKLYILELKATWTNKCGISWADNFSVCLFGVFCSGAMWPGHIIIFLYLNHYPKGANFFIKLKASLLISFAQRWRLTLQM